MFSEELDPASIVQGVVLLQDSSEVAVTKSIQGPTLTLSPQEVLNGFTEYRVVMRGARASAGSPLRDEPPLEDLAGHSLPFDEVLRFTTGDGQPPVLVQSSPHDGAIQVDTRFDFAYL